MAIPNIQLGRVESDPMGVPVATSMRRTEDGGFERLLDLVVQVAERAVDARPIAVQPECAFQVRSGRRQQGVRPLPLVVIVLGN